MSAVEPRLIEPDDAGGGRLPSGRHQLSREFVVSSQRDRLLKAMAELCAENGYHAVRIRDIVERAQVSRTTFYEQFEGKEECLLAAFDAFVDRFLIAFRPGAGREDVPFVEGIGNGIALMLACCAAEPAFARMCVVDMLVAGPRALQRGLSAASLITGYIDRARQELPGREQLPPIIAEAIVGGAGSVIRHELLSGRAERLPELLPDLIHLALSPFFDLDEALSRGAAT